MAPSMRLKATRRPPASQTATLILMLISCALATAPATILLASSSVRAICAPPLLQKNVLILPGQWRPIVDAAPVPVNTRSEHASRSLACPAAYFVPGNHHLVHLVRAVHDTQRAGVTPHQGQRCVVRNSHGTVHLDSAVEHVKIGV